MLAGGCLLGKRMAALLVATQPDHLAQVIQREPAYPQLAEALADRQALFTELDGTIEFPGGGQDAAEGAPRVQLDMSDLHQFGQRQRPLEPLRRHGQVASSPRRNGAYQ